jgi:hypothetical protein
MKKYFILPIAIAVIALNGCNSSNNKSNESGDIINDTGPTQMTNDNETKTSSLSDSATNDAASIKGIVSGYLNVKNALVNDNGKEAAAAGKEIVDAMNKLDKGSLTAEQKKIYEEVEEDAREHAEHIGTNADKIDHQREHFEMLSKDIYDLVKTFGATQILYQDYCPMYNENKGATWISETKEIKNPYFGKKMLKCGELKEEIEL